MTHGYLNRLIEQRDWHGLLCSGVTHLEAVATDWIFGTTPAPPATGGGYQKRPTRRRDLWEEDDEEWLLL